ncbi:MAG TPA: hypothetical protein VKT72_00390 [Candidatus Baltobacteraceae bacterium]|nr:hypothetical protein [Candidatus Baltobacteraceae bacterium]
MRNPLEIPTPPTGDPRRGPSSRVLELDADDLYSAEIPTPSEVPQRVQEAEDAAREVAKARIEAQWDHFVTSWRSLVPYLTALSRAIETSWYEIPGDAQAAIVRLRALFNRVPGANIERKAPQSVGEWLRRLWYDHWYRTHQGDLLPYIYAQVRFMVAVDRALTSEKRRIRAIEDRLQTNEKLRSEIEFAEKQADEHPGLGKLFSAEEFGLRFKSS